MPTSPTPTPTAPTAPTSAAVPPPGNGLVVDGTPTIVAAVALPAPVAAAPSPTTHAVVGAKRKANEQLASAIRAGVSGSNPLRGRSFLNHQQRLEIIKKKDEEPKWTQVQLARWAAVHFGLPKEPSQATIAVLLKKRDQLKAATVRPQTRTIRSPRHPELEAALLLWVRHLQSKRVPFTGENIRLKASELASTLGIETTLNFSTGWMSGFVSRHNLLLARAHKKKPTENDDEPLRAIVKGFDPRNVFALHEIALLYNDLPYSHDHHDQADPKRDRVCVGLAVNSDCSEKLEPLVVTSCRRKLGAIVETFYNVDGLMTARIFEQWLYKLNQRMVATHRKIIVLVNAAPSHFPIQLSNVRLIVLPVATAQRAHPLDGSVTKSFKALYRKTHLSFAVDQAEEGSSRVFDVSISRALIWIKQAWLDVSPELIRTCWSRTGLFAVREQTATADVADIHPEVVQSLVVSLSQLQLLEVMPMEALLSSDSELHTHYVYDDATIARVVAGEGDADDDLHADTEGDSELALIAAQGDLKPTFSADGTIASRPLFADTHVFEKEPSTDELLANYRGVIWSLDAEAERSEDHQTTLRVLRRKQAALRHHHHQQQTQTQTQSSPSPPAAHPTLPLTDEASTEPPRPVEAAPLASLAHTAEPLVL